MATAPHGAPADPSALPERSPLLEDELDELPPLDGDAGDAPDPEPTFENLLDDPDSDATLDDSTGEDDTPESSELELDELDEGERGWLGEPTEAPDLDLGEMGVVDFGDEAKDAEGTPGAAQARGQHLDDVDESSEMEEDPGFGSGPERGDLGGDDEGPVDPDEELREADLPELDADEDGEMDEATLIDEGFVADEPLGLAWAADPWSRVGAPVAFSAAVAVACAPRGAIAVGRSEAGPMELGRVDLEGTFESLAAEGLELLSVRALEVEGDVVVAITLNGAARVSTDGGMKFEPVADALAVAEARVTSGRLWLRTRAGGLLVARLAPMLEKGAGSEDGATDIERCAVPGQVVAISRDGGGVAALVVDDSGTPAAIVRGLQDASLRNESVDDGLEVGSPALLVTRGDCVAYASRRGGVVRRREAAPSTFRERERGQDGSTREGGGWESFTWEGQVTALAFVDDHGTLLAATYSDADDTTALVRLEGSGHASVVARIGPTRVDGDADGRVLAMAHDEARGVVWVAGGFGVAAFAMNLTHLVAQWPPAPSSSR